MIFALAECVEQITFDELKGSSFDLEKTCGYRASRSIAHNSAAEFQKLDAEMLS
jgi:hypothetical protein